MPMLKNLLAGNASNAGRREGEMPNVAKKRSQFTE